MSTNFINHHKKTFGFATSGSGETSRNLLYGRVLKSWATYCGRMAHDSRLINQTLSLVVINGRIDHGADGHDDLCISNLLGHWFLTFGKNLHHYGIRPTDILTVIDSADRELSQEDRYRKFINDRLRNEIRTIGEQMQNEPDEMIYGRLVAKLKRLHAGLSTEEAKSFSISDFLSQVEDKRAINFATR